ncbi:Magnetosome protein MamF [Candidatus Terasakiella magnetica]|uniref:Magnetosome protein MamF n=1 Tax=Candidatus Terasakiella magnetica TaxID=1867952 RepID=A0A1C3RFM2_9PROT|nr:hypothetical protein [Candidatus Terasakiella magnetica]SCA56096.1 Magnetosome protein MamF [Candidatus Terasakiella magnetica]
MVMSTVQSNGGMKSRILAAMSYLGILCFVPLFSNKDDEYVYFHAKQGLIIWVWGVLAVFALHLPGLGKWFFSVSAMAVVMFSLIGFVSVMLNRAWKLPFIYGVSTKI